MSFAITNKQTPNITTYSQPVRSEEVHSDEEAHKKHAHSTSTGLTVPKHTTVHSGKIMSAYTTTATTGGGTAPATTPAPAPTKHFTTDADHIEAKNHYDRYLDHYQDKLKNEALLGIVKAYNAVSAATDATDATAATAALKTEIAKHLKLFEQVKADGTFKTEAEITGTSADELINFVEDFLDKGIKTETDYETKITEYETKITEIENQLKPYKAGYEKYKTAIETMGVSHSEVKTMVGDNKGLGFGRWAGISALALIPAGIAWFMGNNAVKAAEAKADAAKQETEALSQKIEELLRQLGQLMMSMQAKGEKANAQLTNLVARLIKLQGQSLKTASATAYGSVSSAKVASKIVRSDDTSATPANPPAGDDLAKLEAEVAELEKRQASGGGKPAPAQPQGGGTPHAGAMPQPVTMPQQNGQATESPMPQQPETQRIIFHRFPEDARNGAVPTNAFLGDKVITRKVSNTGDRAIIEKDDDC